MGLIHVDHHGDMAGPRQIANRLSPTMHHFVMASVAFVVVMTGVGMIIAFTARGIVDAAASPVEARRASERAFVNTLPVASDTGGRVSIFFAGDVMLDREVDARMRKQNDDIYPFRLMMTDPRFTVPDLRIMNLEGPVTAERRPPEKSIDFAFDPRVIKALHFVGWNGMSQANNHDLDQGRVGADDSRARLSTSRFLVFGDEVRDDDVAIATTTVHGRRIAFVGFNDTSRRVDQTVAEKTLATARQQADTVIVMMHWGEEYHDQPSARQQELATWLVDHGADAVIGGHPHWVQGVTSHNGKPILYSLGNFVFDQDWSQETNEGLAIGLLISDQETVLDLYPITIKKSQPRFLDGDGRAARLRDLSSISDAALTQQILDGRIVLPKVVTQ